MRYSISDCYSIYNSFNKDFFKDELGVKLGSCDIFTDVEKAKAIFGDAIDDYINCSGISWSFNGKQRMWINRALLNSKKLLMNTILHEMIHLYVYKMQPYTQSYRKGHGSLWTKVAAYATELYGYKLGTIDRWADASESEILQAYQVTKGTKSLKNAFLIQLKTYDLIPIKDLTSRQIDKLKDMDIRGIYKLDVTDPNAAENRVDKFATWDTLLDDIELGTTESEENSFNHLRVHLGRKNLIPIFRKNLHS